MYVNIHVNLILDFDRTDLKQYKQETQQKY